MSRIPSRKRVFCGLIFVALLAACCCSGSTAWAQAKSKTAPATKPQVQQLPQLPTGPVTPDQLIAQQYACFGPAQIDSASPQAIVFGGKHGQPGLTISVAGKPMTVMDEAGNIKSRGSLRSGTWVTVCSRADSVIVYITAEKRVGNALH
jgi:hypothetical protein